MRMSAELFEKAAARDYAACARNRPCCTAAQAHRRNNANLICRLACMHANKRSAQINSERFTLY